MMCDLDFCRQLKERIYHTTCPICDTSLFSEKSSTDPIGLFSYCKNETCEMFGEKMNSVENIYYD